ncbi:polyphosphate kinase 1, partial [Senegalimassilia anaerobia]
MKANESTTHIGSTPYMQNRELSWLTFNERVLDQGADETVPLLERLNFISIFWSNLQEFFMVRVGSLTDLSLLKKQVLDSKTGMTPAEQLSAIHKRCHELYPVQEQTYAEVRQALAAHGVRHLRPADLNDEQRAFLADYTAANIMPFLSPQIINSRHPFPHLENGSLYVIVRLNEEVGPKKSKKKDKAKDGKTVKAAKIHPSAEESENLGAEGVTVGILPMPRQCARVIKLPGEGFQFILLEHAVEMTAAQVFSMYTVKHTNVLCVTRNADLDATENTDESDEDYREHMKRILKKRGRLAPVRLESERPLSSVLQELLLDRLNLKPHQTYVTSVPLDMSWTWGLGSNLPEQERMALSNPPFTPQWPACLDRNRSIIEQVCEREVLLSYPYESMDAFVQLLREAAADPTVISIKITLYRLARQSHLAEALIAAAESGKQVTALFELRARFDESNNIEWSQRFEEAGCNVIYGFRDYKVHSKICCITRQTENGLQYITQLGTGNYNEKTAKLYTDLSFITADETIGRDATEFFRNMQLENASDNYDILSVAPLQIKPGIIANIDEQIALAREGKPCGLFFKTNSVTDKDIIVKIAEASQAGVPVTLLVRGISCLVPGVPGYTDNVRVVSIVGRLLEHSRIYGFGPRENIKIYLSSADLMTRNMEKRVEIAWPILDKGLRNQVLDYIDTCLRDTAKLRELKADGTYTKLGELAKPDEPKFESQDFLIKEAQRARAAAAEAKAARNANSRKLMNEQRQAQMAEAEAKVEAVAKAEAAAAEAAREAEAAHKAALE